MVISASGQLRACQVERQAADSRKRPTGLVLKSPLPHVFVMRDNSFPVRERWQQARATTGQTAIKIPPTGPEGHHNGLFDTTVSYIGDKGTLLGLGSPPAKHWCV